MSHVANQRIKMGGKYFAVGDPITLTDEELRDLPKGAVSPESGLVENAAEAAVALDETLKKLQTKPERLSDEQWAKLRANVKSLNEGDFKKDGFIRKDALSALDELLGFAATADDVAAAQAAGEE